MPIFNQEPRVTGSVALTEPAVVGNTVQVTGSVSIWGQSNVTTLTGSVVAILNAGNPVAQSNPLPISDAGGSVTVDGAVTAAQGTAAGIGAPWPVIIVSGSDPVGTATHPTWITGSVYVINPDPAIANVILSSGSITGLLVGGVAVSNPNPVPSRAIGPRSGTLTALTSSVTSQLLVAQNLERIGLMVYNDSPAMLFLKFGVTAASNDFSVRVSPGSFFESSFVYCGRIDGTWTVATGSARITELF